MCDNLAGNPFVFRTDVKSYYASIDHGLLLAQLHDKLDDPIALNLSANIGVGYWPDRASIVSDGG